MKTEEAYRLKSTIEEFASNPETYTGLVGINSYIDYFYNETVSLFEYFKNDDSIVFIDELARVIEKGEAVTTEFRESMINRLKKGYILPGQINGIYSYKELLAMLKQTNLLLISTMKIKQETFNVKVKNDFTVRSINSYNNNFDLLVKDLKDWKKNGYRVLLLSSSRTRAMRLDDDLRQNGLNSFFTDDLERTIKDGEIMVSSGSIHKGFEYPLIKFVLVSESDIFGRKRRKRERNIKNLKASKLKALLN